MAETKVNTFFVSEKISKVRWVPEQLKESERFITGSWDMRKNYIRLWRLLRNPYNDDYNDYVPHCSDAVNLEGDITGLEFVGKDTIVAGCSDGHLVLLKIKQAVEEDLLYEEARSSLLHNFGKVNKSAACTAISSYGKEVASVGEDGRLNLIDLEAFHTVRRTIDADSCALTTVAYINPQEILIANRMGVIRMFDGRVSAETMPISSFTTSCEDEKSSNYVSCLVSHPTQPHIILAGSEEGSITVWDLRQLGYPSSYLSAHGNAISEIGFHKSDPTKLFTSSESGELWLWAQHPSIDSMDSNKCDINPWLNGERTKSRINVTSLISDIRKAINSFDSHGSKIICGSDTEAVYLIDNAM